MADSSSVSFVNYTPISSKPMSAPAPTKSTGNNFYDSVLGNPNYSQTTKNSIISQQKAMEKDAAIQKAKDDYDKANEGRYFGAIGRGVVPGDTRIAQTLAALGINTNFMRAIQAAAQRTPAAR